MELIDFLKLHTPTGQIEREKNFIKYTIDSFKRILTSFFFFPKFIFTEIKKPKEKIVALLIYSLVVYFLGSLNLFFLSFINFGSGFINHIIKAYIVSIFIGIVVFIANLKQYFKEKKLFQNLKQGQQTINFTNLQYQDAANTLKNWRRCRFEDGIKKYGHAVILILLYSQTIDIDTDGTLYRLVSIKSIEQDREATEEDEKEFEND